MAVIFRIFLHCLKLLQYCRYCDCYQ